MTTARIALLLTLTTLTSGCIHSSSNSFEEKFNQTVALAAGGEVAISNINGAVRVVTWDRPEVKIEATKKVRAGTAERAREAFARTVIEVNTSAGRIEIKTRASRHDNGFFAWMLGGSSNSNVTYTVTVPARSNVAADTVNGPVEVRDLIGRVKAETVNGGIDISGIVGSVDAETVNGGIDVGLRALTGDAPMSLSTVNGGITLALPPGAQASIDAEVTNGGIDCDLPLTDRDKSRRHLRGELGGGGVAIELDTTNGGIDIVGS